MPGVAMHALQVAGASLRVLLRVLLQALLVLQVLLQVMLVLRVH